MVDERKGQVEATLHTARVSADLAIGRLDESHSLEELCAAVLGHIPTQAMEAGLEPDVLPAGQVLIERHLLQRRPDDRPHLASLRHHIQTEHARLPCGGREQGGEDVDGGGLPGSVGPQESVDLARSDRQGHAVHGAYAPLELADQPLGLDPVSLHLRCLPSFR